MPETNDTHDVRNRTAGAGTTRPPRRRVPGRRRDRAGPGSGAVARPPVARPPVARPPVARPPVARTAPAALAAIAIALAGGSPSYGAGAVEISVVDGDGRPLRDALVLISTTSPGRLRASSGANDSVVVASAATDASGVARPGADGLPPAADLVVLAPVAALDRWCDAAIEDWKPANVTVRLRPARRIRGLVVDPKERPAPQARVSLRGASDPVSGTDLRTIARKDGTWEFPRVPDGTYTIEAEVSESEFGADDVPADPVTVAAGAANVVPILRSVPAQPQRLEVVRVTDPAGRPIGACESVLTTGMRIGEYSNTATVSGSSAGDCVYGSGSAQPMRFEIYAARSPFGTPLPCGPVVAGPFGPGPSDDVLRLPPEKAPVTGRVVSREGNSVVPVEGARIRAVPRRDDPAGRDPVFARKPGEGPVHSATVTRADGTFRLGQLGAEPYEIVCVPPGSFEPPAIAAAKAGDAGVTFELVRALRVRVSVRDPDGRPVAGVNVAISPSAVTSLEAALDATREAVTGSDGVAVLPVQRGMRYRLSAAPALSSGPILGVFAETTIPDWNPADTVVTLRRWEHISGQVRTPDGAPYPGCVVFLEERRADTSGSAGTSVESGPDGSFSVKVLSGATFQLFAWPPRCDEHEGGRPRRPSEGVTGPVTLPGPKAGVTLVVTPPTSLAVRIEGWTPKHRTAVARYLPKDGPAIDAKVDASGRVRFTGIPWDRPGTVWIGPATGDVFVLQDRCRPQADELVVRPATGGAVSGRVRFPAGSVKRRVAVVLPWAEIPAEVKSDGKFTVRGLPAGTWLVRATADAAGTPLAGETKAAVGTPCDIELR